jgi:putative hydrolase of the HAD superfamily
VWEEYVGHLNGELARYFAAPRPRYRTGILSNSFVGAREREQRLYGFEDMCDVVVYSHEEGMKKPDIRIYEIVCRRLGVAPRETVFVDDTPACVEGAARAGMHAIQFVSNARALAELDALLRPGGR